MSLYLTEANIKLIKEEINIFINKLDFDIKHEKRSIWENADILLILSELLSQKNIDLDEELIANDINIILNQIKAEIDKNNVYWGISMFSNWGTLAFTINNINNKTGELSNLSKSLNTLLLDCLYNYVVSLKDAKTKTTFDSYDIISGPSGPLYYLIKETSLHEVAEYKEKLEFILEFLVSFTDNHLYNNYEVINFHIEKDQQYLESEKEIMKNGHINFGLAHGMIGVLLTLSEAKKMDFKVKNLDLAIDKILNLYEIFNIENDGIMSFPTQLPLEDFISSKKDNIRNMNASWCYGNVSIVRSLMKVYKNNNDYKNCYFYKDKLVKILNQSLEEYQLFSPIVCHGYASPIIIQISAFIDTNDNIFLKTLDRNVSILLKTHKEMLKKNRNNSNEENYYKIKYYDDRSLLNGEGGVILTLLSAITKDITFNKILMVD